MNCFIERQRGMKIHDYIEKLKFTRFCVLFQPFVTKNYIMCVMNGVHLGNFALFMNELHRSISQTTWRVTSRFHF